MVQLRRCPAAAGGGHPRPGPSVRAGSRLPGDRAPRRRPAGASGLAGDHGRRLYCFILDSPKRRDLERDGRYSLHSFPPEDSDDEAYLSGRAERVTDEEQVARLADIMSARPEMNWQLFEFSVEVAMVAKHREGMTDPLGARYEVWREAGVGGSVQGGGDRVQ